VEIVKTRLDYSPELVFTVDVTGTTEPITEVRLTIHDNRKVSYTGQYKEGRAFFKLDELKKYFKVGAFKYDLEIFIGKQFFVPLSGQIEFTEPIRVTADKESLKEPPVAIVQAGISMAKALDFGIPKPEPKVVKKSESEKVVRRKTKQRFVVLDFKEKRG